MNPVTTPTSDSSTRLGRGTVFLYSLTSAGLNMISVTLNTWLLYFYSPPADSGRVILLSPGRMGWVLLAASLWNALIDPFIGHWSDNSRSRRGRRRPFILVGIPIFIVSFLFLWIPFTPSQPLSTSLVLMLILCIHFGGLSLIGVPYDATLAEMAHSSPERLRLSYWKNLFGILGVLAAVMVATPLFTRRGPVLMSLVVGAGGLIVMLGSLRGIRESEAPPGDPLSFRQGLDLIRHNRPFLLFFLAALAVYISYQMLLAIVPYLTTVLFRRPEADVQTIQMLMIGAIVLGGPAWVWAGRRFSQCALLQISLAGMVLSQVLFFLFARSGLFLLRALLLVIPLGFFIGGFLIVAFAYMGTLSDEDFLRSGRRREAIYFGSFTLAMGLGISLGNLLLPVLFGWFGNDRSRPLGVRLGFLVMACFSILAFILLRISRRQGHPPATLT